MELSRDLVEDSLPKLEALQQKWKRDNDVIFSLFLFLTIYNNEGFSFIDFKS